MFWGIFRIRFNCNTKIRAIVIWWFKNNIIIISCPILIELEVDLWVIEIHWDAIKWISSSIMYYRPSLSISLLTIYKEIKRLGLHHHLDTYILDNYHTTECGNIVYLNCLLTLWFDSTYLLGRKSVIKQPINKCLF